jgi:hypothetical protein
MFHTMSVLDLIPKARALGTGIEEELSLREGVASVEAI